MSADLLVPILSGTVVAATPLIYAATGELVTERSGVVNLGVEGMMLIGTVTAFAAAFAGYPPIVAGLAAAGAGALASLVFAVLALSLATNQYAAGLALTILGSGLSAFIGHDFGGASLKAITKLHLPVLSDLPVVGPVLFAHDPMTYLALALVAAVWWFLYRTKAGLVVRIVGEAPGSAHAIGYPVIAIRYAATAFGGAMAGLGGAYLALAYTPLWVENMTAGRGWIALALVVFAAWRPWRILIGAWLFGGVTVLQLFAQGIGIKVPSELLSALPYVATIAVLVAISRNPQTLRLNAPASLGKSFTAQG
ncbi:MAG TPA: ABC transporter permease [Alphaproteobacteria bacterium]|nr:ABC transporter permease [Alphaproteobacteria bacterium]